MQHMEGLLPVRIPRHYFGDISRASSFYLLVTECVLLWMALDGFGWLRMTSDGFGWLRMASDGFGWLTLHLIHHDIGRCVPYGPRGDTSKGFQLDWKAFEPGELLPKSGKYQVRGGCHVAAILV